MKKSAKSKSRALVPVEAIAVDEKKPVAIKLTLSRDQYRVFTQLAEHMEANITAGEVITALACHALENDTMLGDAGLAHLDLSYRILRARTGVIKINDEWPVSAQEEVAK
jgi:hypothetical protein